MKTQSKITKLRQAWKDMIRRCYETDRHNFHRYGGRGIIVCEEWRNSFYRFWEWALKSGFNLGLTLDRVDSDGNYGPNNCRWVTTKVQANNTSTNMFIEHNGERLTYAQWEERLNGCKGLVWNRIKMGWSEVDAVTIPPKKKWSRREKQSKNCS